MNPHVEAGAEIWKAALEPARNCEGLIFSYTIQAYAKAQPEASAGKDGNPFGLDPSLGPVMPVVLLMHWNLVKDDKTIIGASEGALDKMKADASSRGQLVDFTYMNYAVDYRTRSAPTEWKRRGNSRELVKVLTPEEYFR